MFDTYIAEVYDFSGLTGRGSVGTDISSWQAFNFVQSLPKREGQPLIAVLPGVDSKGKVLFYSEKLFFFLKF